MMRNFSGRVWISESDHELARVEVEAVDNVSIGLGLLARLHKGSTLSFERRRSMAKPGCRRRRVLDQRTDRTRRGDAARRIVEFSNYKKFGVDTSTTITLPRKQ